MLHITTEQFLICITHLQGDQSVDTGVNLTKRFKKFRTNLLLTFCHKAPSQKFVRVLNPLLDTHKHCFS